MWLVEMSTQVIFMNSVTSIKSILEYSVNEYYDQICNLMVYVYSSCLSSE